MTRYPLALLLAVALAGIGTPTAALDAGPVAFSIAVPLAPVAFEGEFPVVLTPKVGEAIGGTMAVDLGSGGEVTGTLDAGGTAFAIAGTQSFRNGKGRIALLGTGGGGTLSLKGNFDGTGFAGKAKGTGTAAPWTGTFRIDVSLAEPLVAFLDLEGTVGAAGVVTGGGGATTLGQVIEVDLAGKAATALSLAVTGSSLTFGAKGPPSPAGGWTVSWKIASRGCRNAGKKRPLSVATADLGAGAAAYGGAYPAAAAVALPASHGGGSVQGRPGQAMVFFETPVDASAAATAIAQSGGSVLGKIPAVGYFLAAVSPGSVASFIDAVEAKAGVRFAQPHPVAEYMSSWSGIIDDCNGEHGIEVKQVFQEAGGGYAFCYSDEPADGKPNSDVTLGRLMDYIENNKGSPTLVNISSGGADPKTWVAYLQVFLGALSELPEEDLDQIAITFAAGNQDMDLVPLLAELRQDPRFAEILSRNILLASAGEDVYDGANDAPGDPDVLLLQDASGPGGEGIGTSYASPRALAILRKIVDQKGLSPVLALAAAKLAASRNVDGELIESEALEAADEILGKPIISVRPRTLRFDHVIGDPDPAPKTFAIRNLARKGKILDYEISDLDAWLSVSPGAGKLDGGATKVSTVRVDPEGLAPGTYTATLHVFAPVDETYDENADCEVVLVVKNPPSYSGNFATSMGSHTTFAGCQFGLSLSGTLTLWPKEGAGGAVLGDGDTEGELGIVVTYTPPYTSCTAGPFTESGSGTITGTKANLQISLTNNNNFTMDFTGAWSGDTITGSATWMQEYSADGEPVFKTGSIPNLVLTLDP